MHFRYNITLQTDPLIDFVFSVIVKSFIPFFTDDSKWTDPEYTEPCTNFLDFTYDANDATLQ